MGTFSVSTSLSMRRSASWHKNIMINRIKSILQTPSDRGRASRIPSKLSVWHITAIIIPYTETQCSRVLHIPFRYEGVYTVSHFVAGSNISEPPARAIKE